MASGGDPLRKLAHLLPVENLQQFRLAEQHDLQQLVAVRFKVGQQAQLFKDFYGKVLCLVDDQYGFAPLRIGFEEISVEPVYQLLDAALLRSLNVEFVTDGLKQFNDADLGIEDVSNDHVFGQLLEETAAEGGLAGPDLSGQQNKATVTFDPVFEVRQRLAVVLTHVKIEWVRRDRKRVLIEAEI